MVLKHSERSIHHIRLSTVSLHSCAVVRQGWYCETRAVLCLCGRLGPLCQEMLQGGECGILLLLGAKLLSAGVSSSVLYLIQWWVRRIHAHFSHTLIVYIYILSFLLLLIFLVALPKGSISVTA